MSQSDYSHILPIERCVSIKVYCDQCGELALHLAVKGASPLKALAKYRKFVLELHRKVEHEDA